MQLKVKLKLIGNICGMKQCAQRCKGALLFTIVFGALQLNALTKGEVVYVKDPIARVLTGPSVRGLLKSHVRLNQRLKVLAQVGEYVRVDTLRDSGYVHQKHLSLESLSLAKIQEKLEAVTEPKKKRHLLEQALALAPSHIPLRSQLADTYDTLGEKTLAASERKMVEQNLKRSLSPDGPLYPIQEGSAHLNMGCELRNNAEGFESKSDAPEWLREGKVKILTPAGIKREKLAAPKCQESSCSGLTLVTPTGMNDGVLVFPPWLSNGHRSALLKTKKSPKDLKSECASCLIYGESEGGMRVEVNTTNAKWRVWQKDFSGWIHGEWTPSPRDIQAHPLVLLQEHDALVKLIWRGEGKYRFCCDDEPALWMTFTNIKDKEGKLTIGTTRVGRVFYGATHEGECSLAKEP